MLIASENTLPRPPPSKEREKNDLRFCCGRRFISSLSVVTRVKIHHQTNKCVPSALVSFPHALTEETAAASMALGLW